jgi:hypothetical protein
MMEPLRIRIETDVPGCEIFQILLAAAEFRRTARVQCIQKGASYQDALAAAAAHNDWHGTSATTRCMCAKVS